jgi:U4/U6.U5 tri-snRNP component SNU23
MKPVQARDQPIDFTTKIGKTAVITANTPLQEQGAFYCDVCDCVMKDSQNYLDHINGKKRTSEWLLLW